MKAVLAAMVSVAMLSPAHASAKFSLNSVLTIQCTDAAPTAEMDMTFTTSDAAAQRFPHTATTIGYDYGNLIYGETIAGKMTLQNDPDSDGGAISLLENSTSGAANVLTLEPCGQPGIFTGTLSGTVEGKFGWQNLPSHPMNCQVTYVAAPAFDFSN